MIVSVVAEKVKPPRKESQWLETANLWGIGRIVIPKEIRRTLKIREGDPLLTTLTPIDRFCMAIHSVVERVKAR